MKAKMVPSVPNKTVFGPKRTVWALFLMLILCLFQTHTAFAKSAPSSGSSKAGLSNEVEDRINKAIEEAEKKLGTNPVVEEVRRDIRTNLVPANSGAKTGTSIVSAAAPAGPAQPARSARAVAPAVSTRPARPVSVPASAPAPMAAPDEASVQPVSHALKFKSADPRRQADEIAWKAHNTYVQREQYETAYELSQEALRVDPKNRVARQVQKRIEDDIRERPMDIGGTDRVIQAPDGKIALTVAMADGVVSLEEAEEIAVKNSMMLESLRHRLAAARHKVNEALRAFLPTMNIEMSGGGGVVGGRPYDSERYMANFSQPVFYGGELVFTLKQAQASLRSDELKYQKERTDIVLQVGEAYRNAVSAAHNLNYQTELHRGISEYKARNDKAFEASLVAEIEQLEIASIFNQVEFQKETAVTTQKSANLTLCQAVGVPADRVIPVETTVQVQRMNSIDLDDYLSRVGIGNFDIRIKQATLESAYYGAKVYDAQRKPRVDVRGNVGMAGELSNINPEPFPDDGFSPQPQRNANWVSAGRPDLESEYSIIAEVKMPLGPHTVGYTNQRRFFAPSVSSFQGSRDSKHAITLGILDRLADRTDEEIAKADYLKAMAELQKEKTDQEINARQAYYDYESALLQMDVSEAKILFRERQIKILEHTTRTEDAKLTELLGEMVSLAEDRYSSITAISSANNALAKMNYLAGTEGINNPHEIQPAQK